MVAKFDGDEPPQLLGSDHSHPAPPRWVKIVRPSFPPGQSHFRLVALHPSRARGSIVGFTAPTGSRDQAMESRGRSTAPAWRKQAFGTFTRGKPKNTLRGPQEINGTKPASASARIPQVQAQIRRNRKRKSRAPTHGLPQSFVRGHAIGAKKMVLLGPECSWQQVDATLPGLP